MAWLHPLQQLDVGSRSDRGRQRQNNEDSLGTFKPDDADRLAQKGELFLVADGMGGHRSGEAASRKAVDQIIRRYMSTQQTSVAASLRQAIEATNATLYNESAGRGGRQQWGTTLVAAVIRHDQLWIANVGDSRAYLLRDGRLQQLSRDHTLAAEMGVTPSEEGIGRHLITRALGLKPEVRVEILDPPLALRSGDQILLCSDGLTDPLPEPEIRDILRVPRPAELSAQALVQAANDRGGPDNISAMVIRVVGPITAPERPTPRAILVSLTQPEAWRQAAADLQAMMTGGKAHWTTLIFVLAGLLIALAIVSLGFALGWALLSG